MGYRGRSPQDCLNALTERRVSALVDVRLHPNRAFIGFYVKGQTPEKGIERLLTSEGIKYARNPGLFGNPFIDVADWRELSKARRTARAGDVLEIAAVLDSESPRCSTIDRCWTNW
jgi:hypothetical protein